MRTELDSCEAIIKTLAALWIKRLPAHSVLEYEDLMQEGWIAYHTAKIGGKYDPEKGKSFTSFIYYAVNSRLKGLLSYELRVRRIGAMYSDSVDDPDFTYQLSVEPDQERAAMLHDALAAMSEVSVDFVKMIVEGVPKELLGIARRRMRSQSLRAGFDPVNGTINIEKSMVEAFFKVNIDDLKKMYYSFI